MPSKRANRLKNPIPEDFELSDDEPRLVNLMRNEIEINPKGITCRCNPCSFKLTKNDKTMNVSKDDDGGITLDSADHSISFAWNKQITPEDQKVESTNRMISEVMNTPINNKKPDSLNDVELKY